MGPADVRRRDRQSAGRQGCRRLGLGLMMPTEAHGILVRPVWVMGAPREDGAGDRPSAENDPSLCEGDAPRPAHFSGHIRLSAARMRVSQRGSLTLIAPSARSITSTAPQTRPAAANKSAHFGAPGWFGWLSVHLSTLAQVVIPGLWDAAPSWALC